MNLQSAASNAWKYLGAHRTQLLTFGAIGGVALTTITALVEGPEIKRAIEETMKDLRETPKEDKATRRVIHREVVRKVGPRVAKIMAAAAFTMSCIHCLNVVHTNNYMAASALAAASQKKIKDITDATRDVVGDKKLEQIKEKVAEKQAKEKPEFEEKDTFDGKGFAVYDPYSGYKFHVKDPADLLNARALMQEELNNSIPFVSINDFYSKAQDDRPINFLYSDRWGWGMGQHVDIDWRIGGDEFGHPCYVLDYDAFLETKPSGDLCYYG